MMMVKNELHRYLEPCVEHLLEFCAQIRVVDDHSDDGSLEYLQSIERVEVLRNPGPGFFEHEGRVRQTLLEWTFQAKPTHVLAIDADEFVADGVALREGLERGSRRGVWSLVMDEVWDASEAGLLIRTDGGWRPHPVPVLFAVPAARDRQWRINPRPLACGRSPVAVTRHAGSAQPCGSSLLHMGWANRAERASRHHRYVVADGGRFHAGSHLDSIMWDDDRVDLTIRHWPERLEPWRETIAYRAELVLQL